MKNKNTPKLLVYLQRTQMSVYKQGSNKIETWTFDPALINDLEIKDEEKFRPAIDAFVNPLKLEGGDAVILLDSSVYFTQKLISEAERKEAEEAPDSENPKVEEPGLIEKVNIEEDEKLKFMHSMPFSNVFATVLNIGKEKVVFSLNRDFYEPFIKEFTDRKYEVTYIYPIAVVNEIFGSAGFTAATAESLIQAADKFKIFSFLQAPIKKEIGPTPKSTVMPEPQDRKRLYLMIGTFVVLIGILVAVILWSRARDAALYAPKSEVAVPAAEQTANSVSPPTPEARAVETAPDASQSATPDLSEYVVTVRNGGGTDEQAELLQERLLAIGFTQITIVPVSNQSADTTLVVVKPTVTSAVRQVLQTELINLGYSVSFQESQEVSDDISINITSQ